MSSKQDGTNVPTPSSSPADSAPPAGSPPGEPPRPGPLNAFDADFLARLEDRDEPAVAEALMSSPEALSFFLEACGKVVLERAGAILEERVVSAAV